MNLRGVMSAGSVGVVLVAGGAAAALALSTERVPADLTAARVARSSALTRQAFDDQRNVQASFVVSPARTLTGRTTGTVTATRCRPGRPLRSGTVLLRVDDRPVAALHTNIPLYRDLERGARGNDVKALQRALSRQGYSLAVDGRFGTSTRRAVRALQQRTGMPSPSGTVRLSDYVWLPTASLTPVTCDVQIGDTVAPGAGLATFGGGLAAVTLKSWPTELAPGKRTLSVFGVQGPLSSDHRALNPTFLAKVAATPDFQAYQLAKSTEPTAATIQLAHSVNTWKVPPSAVFGIDGKHACLASGPHTYPVTVVGADLGASLVTGHGEPPKRVDLGSAITAHECG